MKLSNIRPNFTYMNEQDQRQFFWQYADNREKDFQTSSLITVKPRKTSSISTKEPKFKVTDIQLQLLKTLGLV
jgi:hypothetical protein